MESMYRSAHNSMKKHCYDLNPPFSLADIVMTERERKFERSLAAAQSENAKLRAALVLEKGRTEREHIAEQLKPFTGSAPEHENDYQAAVIEPSPLHEEFSPVESEETPQHSADDLPNQEPRSRSAFHTSFSVRDAVEEIQRWLFMEGGHMKDVEEMISEYCVHVRRLGIPLDRLFIGGLMLHPQVSAYVWKWEVDTAFDGHEIPCKDFEQKTKLFSADEPFTVLMDGRASSVRMRSTDEQIPKDCQWFRKEGYQDYLALPMLHRGDFIGGMAWSSKKPSGFCEEEIEFFHRSLSALTTVMRLHTNDLVMKTLVGRLEEEVLNRTRELEAANVSIEKVSTRVLKQSAAQLKHFAMMSHEIRTPLNCIIGVSSLLLDTPMDATQQEFVRMINNSGDLLCTVVNDVLDYSRLESGNVEVNIRRTNLRETMATVVTSIEIKGRERNLVVRSLLGDSLPVFVDMDGSRVQQILFNLLGNAIKFSKEGGAIDLSVLVCDKKASMNGDNDKSREKILRFIVRDHGKGIEKKDIEKIFLPFDQGSKETERLYGGTGLGLAITSKLVKVLGGNIRVDSEPGEWCEFVVDLPYIKLPQSAESTNLQVPVEMMRPKIATQPLPMTMCPIPRSTMVKQMSPAAAQSKNQSLAPAETETCYANIRVLVAEDNKINRKVMQRMLERLGIQRIDIVENGQEAVDREASQRYDFILMDMQMPVMDGLEATRRIVARPRLGSTDIAPKIFFVTAHALDTFQARAEEAGGDGFISKPFNLQKIESVFRQSRRKSIPTRGTWERNVGTRGWSRPVTKTRVHANFSQIFDPDINYTSCSEAMTMGP
jgi:signal transduction histidine kinase/CheY-like chemotaxis protein